MDSKVVSLKEWLDSHNINHIDHLKELENIFYMMDLQMKGLHNYNYYISDFNVYSIFVSGDSVSFQSVSLMDSDDREHYVNQNIYYLACLELAIYSDCLNYINPNNKEYLKSNFNDFSIFLPEEVSLYYKGVFVNDLSIYLSDFVRMKTNKEMGFDTSSSDNANTNAKGVSITKSTLAGRLMSENDNNKAAFVRILLFPFILLFLSILIPLMIILSS